MEEVITLLEVYNAVQEVKSLVADDDFSRLVDILDDNLDGEITTDAFTVPADVYSGIDSIFSFVGWLLPYDLYFPLLNYLMSAAQKGEYVSRCKDIEVIYSNKGCSVCHGSRLQSSVYIRIYDKKLERGRDDLDHWVRCEMKLKDDCARGFIKLSDDIRKNYFDVLNNYLRYVVPSDNNTNKGYEF